MLPLSTSLRRAAARALAGRMPHAASAAPVVRSSSARVSVLLRPVAVSNAMAPTAPTRTRLFSTISADDVDVEDAITEVVLEPLPSRGGFVDQKPLSAFDLSEQMLDNLDAAGITHLFPVQAQSFDIMMKGTDIVGRSKTGSGKTLAFGLPIVEKLLAESPKSRRDPRALILLPTRELAVQVAEEIKRISPQLRIVNVVGGVSYTTQENQLRRGVDILVGTPGRIMDLVDKGTLALDEVRVSVLDEADMMLKFGFQEAVETILGWVPRDGQTVLWSATFPKWVNAMAKKFTRDAVSIDLVGHDDTHVPATVSHKAIHAPLRSRVRVLEKVLRHHARDGQTLIFTETKQEVDEIANALGNDVRPLHGDLSQGMRSSTMEGFRNGSVKTLVCTDIAARGLDIANVELVVQYRLPGDKESFVHRAGRTGRAGRSGTNVVFFDRQDAADVKDFEKRYKFTFAHAAPPQVEQIMDAAIEDVNKKLADVPKESIALFEAAAQQMLQDKGIAAVSSALALLCGFDNEHLSSVSMLTGRHKMQTIEVDGVPHGRQLQELLVGFDDRISRRDIHTVDGKFVFDIPQHSLDQLREHFLRAGAEDVTVSPVMELSRVLHVLDQAPRRDARGGGSMFGGNRGGNSGGRGRGGDRRGGNGGRNGGGSWDFTSSFSRGGGRGRDRDRERDGNRRGGGASSAFGRFSSSKRSSGGGFRESW